MISTVIEILQEEEFIGVSKRVDIAKGVNSKVTSWEQMRTTIKRIRQWQRR